MIRNALTYHLPAGWPWNADAMSEYLSRRIFQPCGQLDHESSGFVPPRGDASLCHAVSGFLLICLQTEERILPAYVVTEHAELKAEELTQLQGYKPGRKQMREIKEASNSAGLRSAIFSAICASATTAPRASSNRWSVTASCPASARTEHGR